MERFVQYYGQFQGLRGQVGGLPGWARTVLSVAALPGILLVGLSIVAVLVSLLALLLLTVPLYRLLRAITVRPTEEPVLPTGLQYATDGPGRKRVEVTVIE